MFGGWKGSFVPGDYSKYKEIYSVARACKDHEDTEKCILFAHALSFLPLLEPNPPVAEKILTAMCCERKNATGCLVLGDFLSKHTDPRRRDLVGESAEAYKASCILGDPSGCRKYAELCKTYNKGDNERSLRWNTAAYQFAKKQFSQLEKSDNKSSGLADSTESQPQRPNEFYKIPNQPPDDESRVHFEIAKSISNILSILKNTQDEISLVDVSEISQRQIDFNDSKHAFKRSFIYRLHLMTNQYKNGYFISNKIKTDGEQYFPEILTNLFSVPMGLPVLTSDVVSVEELKKERDYHWNIILEKYEELCENSIEGDEETGCYHLGKLWKEFYGIHRDKNALENSISAFKRGCSKKQLNCCNTLGEMYSVARRSTQLSEDVKEFNHKRAKYFYYQACENNPLYCLDFANVLKEEGDMENARKMLTHACKTGRNMNACILLIRSGLAKEQLV